MKLRFLSFALLAPCALNAQVPGDVFRGGPVEGMVAGPVVASGHGFDLLSLLPSKANSAPPSSDHLSATVAFMTAMQKGGSVDPASMVSAATSVWCPAAPSPHCESAVALSSFKLPAALTPNTPYQMRDGTVRVEWLEKGVLKYSSWLTFSGSKISSVKTMSNIPVPVMRTLGGTH